MSDGVVGGVATDGVMSDGVAGGGVVLDGVVAGVNDPPPPAASKIVLKEAVPVTEPIVPVIV